MSITINNRKFILDYHQAISGKVKTEALMNRFTSDSKLIEDVLFFEQLIPRYKILIDELTSEGDRVIVHGRKAGKNTGQINGEPPTYKTIEIPFATGYRIDNQKIFDHWNVPNQMDLLEQLGLIKKIKQ